MKNSAHLGVIALAMLIFSVQVSLAQSAVINVPSNDVLPKGRMGIRLVTKFKPTNQDARRKYSSFTPRIFFGVGRNVEVGVNFLGSVQPGVDRLIVVPSVKWRFYNNEKNGVALVAGNNLYIPVRKKTYDVGTYFYTQASKTFKSKTRVTVGAFYFSKNVSAKNAARSGGQFAIEQPLNKTYSLAAEWLTGKHANGVMTAGLRFRFGKHFVGSIGYSIANDRAAQGAQWFSMPVGVNLN
jgi:hypothetical protein